MRRFWLALVISAVIWQGADAEPLHRTADLTMWWQRPLVKVFPDSKPSEAPSGPVHIFAARGEREAFQVVFSGTLDVRSVALCGGELQGPAAIPAANVQVLWVEYVKVERPSGPHGKPGWHPDPLPEKLRGGLRAGRNLAAWVTVKIPRDAKAGEYRGTLAAALDGQNLSLPFALTVWDFGLPRHRRLLVDGSYRPSALRAHGEDDEDSVERYLQNMAEHGVTATGVPRPRVAQTRQGEVQIDLQQLDRHIERCRALGIRHLPLPTLWVRRDKRHRWPSSAADASWPIVPAEGGRPIALPIFAGATEQFDPKFQEAFTKYLRQMTEHYRQRGWLERAWAQFIDEPDMDHAPTVARIQKLCELIHRTSPELRIAQSRPPHPALLPTCSAWMLQADMFQDSGEAVEAARKRGHWIGIYQNTIPMIDYSPLRVRAFPWGLWTSGINWVSAWWTLTNWANNPWATTESYVGRNGDGVLLYPPRDRGEQGPITSIRWETFRDGLEDYDYLSLLERLAARQQPPDAQAQQLLQEARQVMPKLPRVKGAPDEPYLKDAEAFYNLRRRIAEQIVKLRGETHRR
jgi:hypothetical protein